MIPNATPRAMERSFTRYDRVNSVGIDAAAKTPTYIAILNATRAAPSGTLPGRLRTMAHQLRSAITHVPATIVPAVSPGAESSWRLRRARCANMSEISGIRSPQHTTKAHTASWTSGFLVPSEVRDSTANGADQIANVVAVPRKNGDMQPCPNLATSYAELPSGQPGSGGNVGGGSIRRLVSGFSAGVSGANELHLGLAG